MREEKNRCFSGELSGPLREQMGANDGLGVVCG